MYKSIAFFYGQEKINVTAKVMSYSHVHVYIYIYVFDNEYTHYSIIPLASNF